MAFNLLGVTQNGVINYRGSTGTDYWETFRFPSAGSGSGASSVQYFGALHMRFPNYSKAWTKGWYADMNFATDATLVGASGTGSAGLAASGAFTKFKFYINYGNFVSGSKIRLYGSNNS